MCKKNIYRLCSVKQLKTRHLTHTAVKLYKKQDWESVFIKQLLYPPDDYTGFTLSCPPTFYNKIAPMFIGDAEAGEVFTKRGN